MFNDLRYGLRIMLKSPGFTAVVILTLALGIGANTAIFSLINALLLRDLPVKHPEELVLLRATRFDGNREEFMYPEYEALRDNSKDSAGLLASSGIQHSVLMRPRQAESAQSMRTNFVSGNYFAVLKVGAAQGRTFTDEDDVVRGSGGPDGIVAVMTYPCWERRFGRDPSVVGQQVTLNNATATIIGVTPPEFFGIRLGMVPDLFVPIKTMAGILTDDSLLGPGFPWLNLVGRLSPGASQKQLTDKWDAVFHGFLTEMGQGMASSGVSDANIQKFLDQRLQLVAAGSGITTLRERFSKSLFVLMAVVSLLLLIACANIASLLLSRGEGRKREMATRMAVGASRSRLIRQLLTESLLLGLGGGLLGLASSYWFSDFLASFLLTNNSIFLNLRPDSRVLGFTWTLTMLTSMVFGIMPALTITSANVQRQLKAAGSRGSKALVVAQVALSLVLLVGSGLFLRTLQNIRAIDSRFEREDLLLFTLNTDELWPLYGNERLQLIAREVLNRLNALPEVKAASICGFFPMDNSQPIPQLSIGGEASAAKDEKLVRQIYVDQGFFKTLDIPILQGQDFSQPSQPWAPKEVIINESLARSFFGSSNPVGRYLTLKFGGGARSIPVVGVVKDSKYADLREQIQPTLFLRVIGGNFVVRTIGSLEVMATRIRREVRSVDPNLALKDLRTLNTQAKRALIKERLIAFLVGLFTVVALLLVCIGLFGLLTHRVNERTNEIGIRMALGARSDQVVWLVFREAWPLVILGVVIGVSAAVALGRWITSLLYGLTSSDPLTLTLAVLMMVAVAACAAYLPARRASRVDPMVALRYE